MTNLYKNDLIKMQLLTGNEFQELKFILESNLNVSLMSEDITFYFLDDNATTIKVEIEEKVFDVYGVKSNDGIIVGHVEKFKLDTREISKYYESFRSEDFLSRSTPLWTLLGIFPYKERMFILENNTIKKLLQLLTYTSNL